ncbi:MAG: FAD-dependent oxidoreductase, partial [Alistipes sp.]|nr:FAD-dependent oxidoreductase [Alistipes sp.]
LGKISKRKCVTRKLKVHGWRPNPDLTDHMYVYGSDELLIRDMINQNPALGEKLSEKYDYTVAEVLWAVRKEMAFTVEDVLARRVRLLFVDAREAQKAAPRVAQIMAQEMGKDEKWIEEQIAKFNKVSDNYIVVKQ